jgi:hypothetical protein
MAPQKNKHGKQFARIEPFFISMTQKAVAIVGAGPAGLIAAEVLAAAGLSVMVYDAMPSAGRKFLQAGRGGLNITHSASFDDFIAVYGHAQFWLAPILMSFGSEELQQWVHRFGIDTFVGTSGRIFPTDKKAAPLLRAWIHRLKQLGVHFEMKHRLLDIKDDRQLVFVTPDGQKKVMADAVILALGGGSWAKLGSDGQWVSLLAGKGIDVAALKPANCGFDVIWTDFIKNKFAGQPLKGVVLSFQDSQQQNHCQKGELMLTKTGLEGGLIYHFSALLRDELEHRNSTTIYLDLMPDWSRERLLSVLKKPKGSKTMSNWLRSQLNLSQQAIALLHEIMPKEMLLQPQQVATFIKALPIILKATRPIDEAISTAGGVKQSALTDGLMLKQFDGVYCAGEMLDWEAPTGGYLLTAVMSTGVWVGHSVLDWLNNDISTRLR